MAKRPLTIGVLSLSFDNSIEEFVIGRIKTNNTIPTFHELTSGDLNSLSSSKDWDGVILVHPASEGRLSLTDVTDARYNHLIPALNNKYEKEGVLIVCYQLQNVKKHTQDTRLKMVMTGQPTAYDLSAGIIFCEHLSQMYDEDIGRLQSFVESLWLKEFGTNFKDKFPVEKPLNNGGPTLSSNKGSPLHEESGIPERKVDRPEKYVERKDQKETTPAKDEVVLVTDALGFIGSHIVQQLTQKGFNVRGALDLEEGTLDSYEKGTLDNVLIQVNVGMIKGLFPKLDLFEAGIHHYKGWKKAVEGCTHVIHTSRFHDSRPATEDDVEKLLEVCQFVGGIQRVVLTGGSDLISEEKLRDKEWNGIESVLKDAICKHVSEKAAARFMIHQTEKPTFGLSIVKPPVVLGPILCELAEANVEIVRRRMVNTSTGMSDICIPICDVRDVAEAHIMALYFADAKMTHTFIPRRLNLVEMAGILKNEFKDQDYNFSPWSVRWDSVARCLSDLYCNIYITRPDEQMARRILVNNPKTKQKSVIDMAYSCIERGFIKKMPGYRPR